MIRSYLINRFDSRFVLSLSKHESDFSPFPFALSLSKGKFTQSDVFMRQALEQAELIGSGIVFLGCGVCRFGLLPHEMSFGVQLVEAFGNGG